MHIFEIGKKYLIKMVEGETWRTAVYIVVDYQHPLIKVVRPSEPETIINTASMHFISAERH